MSEEALQDFSVGVPVSIVSGTDRLHCPHDDCRFHYWTRPDRLGRRSPAASHKYSAFDEECEHFLDFHSASSTASLESVLAENADGVAMLYLVVPHDPARKTVPDGGVAIFGEYQTGLQGF